MVDEAVLMNGGMPLGGSTCWVVLKKERREEGRGWNLTLPGCCVGVALWERDDSEGRRLRFSGSTLRTRLKKIHDGGLPCCESVSNVDM